MITQKQSIETVDFSYYKPLNRKQAEFHASKAIHKLLIGGYRAGKTYPAIHEAFFLCLYDNPNHEFLVARNTWDSLKENIMKDMLRISDRAGAHTKFDKSNADLYLKSGTVIRFRPLTLTREQFKGMNLCGFLIDDPDVERFKEVISFLFTRLTNPPNVKANRFETIICANYEGHNWLWKTYIRGRKEGGDDVFAYWLLQTIDNPTLPPDYIKTLEAIHSRAWMERYVYTRLDSYSGLIYDEYNPQIHNEDLSFCFYDNNLIKIMAIDVGITHPTVVLKLATDGENIYVYDEWYKTNIRVDKLGFYLQEQLKKDYFRAIIIDPASAKTDQTSGSSVKEDLRKDFGIMTTPGTNAVNYGIEIVKSFLTIREENNNQPRLFIDPIRCPNTIREIETYRWDEPEMMDFDELAYTEKPVKKDDDCMDALRYGVVYLKKYISFYTEKETLAERREKLWEERYKKLRLYAEKRSLRYKREWERLQKIKAESLYT